MRFTRCVTLLLAVGLIGLPALVISAAPATAATLNTRLTIARQPPKQVYGQPIAVLALLEGDQGGTWTAESGQSVVLDRRIAGSSTYRPIATGTTRVDDPATSVDETGTVVFTTTAVANAAYRLRYVGSDTFAPSISSGVGVKVARDLGARENKISGPKFRFFGKVHPKYARKRIVLQKKLGGGAWKTIVSQRTTRHSRWSFIVFARSGKGVVRYRTFTAKSRKYIKSYSATFKITTF
jgi:hypothetical protein